MTAFVTGSRVYGLPDAFSDIDMVILCNYNDLALLQQQADESKNFSETDQYHGKGWSLRFGMLNILVLGDVDTFRRWQECTTYCEYITLRIGRKLNSVEAKKIFHLYVDNRCPFRTIEQQMNLDVSGLLTHQQK